MTDGINHEAMDTRDYLKQSRDFRNYKLGRNNGVRMLTETKADYYIKLIEENRRDTRALWAALMEISPSSTTTSAICGTWLAMKIKSITCMACLDYLD